MRIKLLNNQIAPKKSHIPDSGADIFLSKSFNIDSLETKTIGLDMCVSIPEGFAGMIVPRSSIAEKGLIIQTSIIDPDYTGEIHLIITNCSKNKLSFEKGERLCSIVCVNILNFYIQIVDKLNKTERDDKGLGSTGK